MQSACYVRRVARIIQVRDVPDDVHEALARRADLLGQSLSEYLRSELTRIAGRPSAHEWLARVQALGPVSSPWSSDELVRRARRGE